MTGVLINRGSLHTGKMKAKISTTCAQAREHHRLPENHQKPGDRPGTDSASRPQKEPPCPHLAFEHPASSLVKQWICWLSHPVCGNLLQQSQETNTAGEGMRLCWPPETLEFGSQWEARGGFWLGKVPARCLSLCPTSIKIEGSLGRKVSGSQPRNKVKLKESAPSMLIDWMASSNSPPEAMRKIVMPALHCSQWRQGARQTCRDGGEQSRAQLKCGFSVTQHCRYEWYLAMAGAERVGMWQHQTSGQLCWVQGDFISPGIFGSKLQNIILTCTRKGDLQQFEKIFFSLALF